MNMQRRTPGSGPTFLVGDVTQLPFCNSIFDAVIDKGTSDTLFFRNANTHRCALVTAMWREVARVLRADGVYINITPRMRVPWQRDLFPVDQGWLGAREAFTFDPEQLESCLQLKLEVHQPAPSDWQLTCCCVAKDPRRGQERKETVYVHTHRRTTLDHCNMMKQSLKTKAERRAERRMAALEVIDDDHLEAAHKPSASAKEPPTEPLEAGPTEGLTDVFGSNFGSSSTTNTSTMLPVRSTE